MKSYRYYLLGVSGFVVLLGSFVLSVPRPTQGQGDDSVGQTRPVLVVNAPADPVPVAGTVNVGNFGGGPLPVHDLDNPARQPVQSAVGCITDPHIFCTRTIFTVPPGKRLVIEYASMQALLSDGQAARFRITPTVGEASVIHEFLPSSSVVQPSGGSTVSLSQQVRLYADPGTNVGVTGILSGGGSATFNFSMSGYLVDVP